MLDLDEPRLLEANYPGGREGFKRDSKDVVGLFHQCFNLCPTERLLLHAALVSRRLASLVNFETILTSFDLPDSVFHNIIGYVSRCPNGSVAMGAMKLTCKAWSAQLAAHPNAFFSLVDTKSFRYRQAADSIRLGTFQNLTSLSFNLVASRMNWSGPNAITDAIVTLSKATCLSNLANFTLKVTTALCSPALFAATFAFIASKPGLTKLNLDMAKLIEALETCPYLDMFQNVTNLTISDNHQKMRLFPLHCPKKLNTLTLNSSGMTPFLQLISGTENQVENLRLYEFKGLSAGGFQNLRSLILTRQDSDAVVMDDEFYKLGNLEVLHLGELLKISWDLHICRMSRCFPKLKRLGLSVSSLYGDYSVPLGDGFAAHLEYLFFGAKGDESDACVGLILRNPEKLAALKILVLDVAFRKIFKALEPKLHLFLKLEIVSATPFEYNLMHSSRQLVQDLDLDKLPPGVSFALRSARLPSATLRWIAKNGQVLWPS